MFFVAVVGAVVMCVIGRVMELWETVFAGCGKRMEHKKYYLSNSIKNNHEKNTVNLCVYSVFTSRSDKT